MSKPKASPLIFFFGLLAIIAIISLLGPEAAALAAGVGVGWLVRAAWVRVEGAFVRSKAQANEV